MAQSNVSFILQTDTNTYTLHFNGSSFTGIKTLPTKEDFVDLTYKGSDPVLQEAFKNKTLNTKEIDDLVNASQKTTLASSKTSTTSQDVVFQTIPESYGNVPQRDKVKALANSGIYGDNITTLMWPSDLLDESAYNGCFTVFYISELKQTAIAQKAGNTVDTRYTNSAGSDINTNSTTKQNTNATTNATVWLGAYKALTAAATAVLGSSGLVGGLIGAGSAAAAKLAIDQLKNDAILSAGEYAQLKTAIVLPTPIINDNNEINWDQEVSTSTYVNLSHIGGPIIDNSLDLLNSLNPTNFQNLGQGLDTVKDAGTKLAGAFTGAVKKTPKTLFVASLQALSGFGIGTLSRYIGKSTNPRKESIFKDVSMRKFDFKYNLYARNAQEMQNIQSIIRVLKYHAYPQLAYDDYLYLYPAQFDIVHYFIEYGDDGQIKDGVNPWLPRHTTSVLTKVDVDYSGNQDSMQVHYDGSPVLITLSLSFAEIAVLTKDDIAKGY